jgi:hypothetical protein
LKLGTIKHSGSQWHIDCEPHVQIRLKRVFGKVSKYTEGTVKLADTPENCRDIAWFLSRYPLTIDDKDRRRLAEQSLYHKENEIFVFDLINGRTPPLAFDLAVPPREYQLVASSLAYKSGGLLIADSVGLGKTAMAICLLSKPETLPAVVVVPTHLVRQWEDEIHRFAPHLKTHVIKRGTPYDVRDIFGLPDVFIINYHKLTGWASSLKGIKTLILDEAQEARRKESDKYKALRVLSKGATWRCGLSATPIHNYGTEEYFNVYQILAPGQLGTREEFGLEWGGGTTTAGSRTKYPLKNPRAFGSWLRSRGLMIRRTRADVGRELPPVTKVRQIVNADIAALDSISDQCAELARIILGEGQEFKGQKMLAGGQLDVALRQATGVAKAPYVAEFVKLILESGEKVLLSGWHRMVYQIWMEKLSAYHPVLFTGSETAREKEQSKKAFVEGDSQLLIMSNRSGSGVDGLQKVCRIAVVGELDWAPPVHEQFIGRLARDEGMDGGVIAYFMVSEYGADPIMEDVLGLKRGDQIPVLDPKAPLIEEATVDPEHIRKLAARYLAARGFPPEAAVA